MIELEKIRLRVISQAFLAEEVELYWLEGRLLSSRFRPLNLFKILNHECLVVRWLLLFLKR